MKEKIEWVLVRATEIFLFAAILSPLVSHSRFVFPFSSPAIFFFQISVLLGGICFLALVALHPRYLPPINIFTVSMTLFFIIQGALIFFSVEPFHTFMGSVERMNGFWNNIHYYFFFIIAVGLAQHKENFIRRIIIWSVCIASLVGAMYFVLIIDPNMPYARYSFGNPGFIANYIVLHIPFILWLWLKEKNREKKIILSLLLIFLSAAVFSTGNRSAFLGWLSIFFLSLGYFAVINRTFRKAALLLFTCVIITSGSIFVAKNTDFVKNTKFLVKFTSWSFQEESIRSRFLLWKVAWKGFLDKPITGWGRENFPWVFEKYYDPEFYATNPSEPWFDSAHNAFLDELVFGGIIGLTGLMALGFIFLFIPFLYRKRIEDPFVSVGIFIFFAAYGVQVLFTLNGPHVFLPMTLGMSIAAIIFSKNIPQLSASASSSEKSAVRLRTACFILLLGTTWLSAKFTFSPLLANYYAGDNVYAIPYDAQKTIKNHASIKNLLGEHNSYYIDLLMIEEFHVQKLSGENPDDPRVAFFEQLLIPKYAEAAQNNPSIFFKLNLYRWVLMNDLTRRTNDPRLKKAALEFWEDLIQKYPNRPLFLLNTSDINKLNGNWQRSISLIKRVIELAPKSNNIPMLQWVIGEIYLQQGQEKEALVAFQDGVLTDYFRLYISVHRRITDDLAGAVRVANFLASHEEGLITARNIYIWIIENVIKSDPAFHANLAYIYAKLGEKDEARLEAEKALALDPLRKAEVEKFLQSLEAE